MSERRIFLSPPHMGERECELVQEVFASNWIAPVGPQVDAFEEQFADLVKVPACTAVSSGTAALHLALVVQGVGPGDDVMVSTLTFVGSVNPIHYVGGRPVFIDSERQSWNMDPDLLADSLERRARRNRLPRAVIVVHLYGQCANLDGIRDCCREYDIPLIEDAAEALGSDYRGRAAGTVGRFGIFSFNGNKVITTAGGGMLVAESDELIQDAKKLATQAREDAPHYEHTRIGYNYRMSNVLAAIGLGQLEVLSQRIEARRRVFEYYQRSLSDIPGLEFMPECDWGRHTRWLTTLTIDPSFTGVTRETVRSALEIHNIEARPVWKPMHQQPIFKECERVGGAVADEIFEHGLCLPSGTNMTADDLDRVVRVVRGVFNVDSTRQSPRQALHPQVKRPS